MKFLSYFGIFLFSSVLFITLLACDSELGEEGSIVNPIVDTIPIVEDTVPYVYVPSEKISNITKECTSLTSNLVGADSGWASRYWDCCKPHCSWSNNAVNPSRTCNINNVELEREELNFYDRYKSGCDADGEAFACYSHAPFAVCEDLAYGFAAVPDDGGDMCGKCFQLDFDGGFQNGEATSIHKLLAGKKMIVMASNVGGDVSTGQFDIMIPGGGLGIYTEGCAKQWNVDPNDESLVGANLGGFFNTCYDELGNDVPPRIYSECITNMCENLFGNDPAKVDLLEGCFWYADWMHGADNPTFTYKEVDCPQELLDLW